jgi:pilus assembly protein Flp/PilA
MRDVTKFFGALLSDDSGASAVEYGLLVAAIAAVIVVILFALGGVISQVFNTVCTEITSGVNNAGGSVTGC